MVDTYTKVILTIIAVSLSTIAFKDFFVTPVNAGIDGLDDWDFNNNSGFNSAVKTVITEECYVYGGGRAYDNEKVSLEVYLDCNETPTSKQPIFP